MTLLRLIQHLRFSDRMQDILLANPIYPNFLKYNNMPETNTAAPLPLIPSWLKFHEEGGRNGQAILAVDIRTAPPSAAVVVLETVRMLAMAKLIRRGGIDVALHLPPESDGFKQVWTDVQDYMKLTKSDEASKDEPAVPTGWLRLEVETEADKAPVAWMTVVLPKAPEQTVATVEGVLMLLNDVGELRVGSISLQIDAGVHPVEDPTKDLNRKSHAAVQAREYRKELERLVKRSETLEAEGEYTRAARLMARALQVWRDWMESDANPPLIIAHVATLAEDFDVDAPDLEQQLELAMLEQDDAEEGTYSSREWDKSLKYLIRAAEELSTTDDLMSKEIADFPHAAHHVQRALRLWDDLKRNSPYVVETLTVLMEAADEFPGPFDEAQHKRITDRMRENAGEGKVCEKCGEVHPPRQAGFSEAFGAPYGKSPAEDLQSLQGTGEALKAALEKMKVKFKGDKAKSAELDRLGNLTDLLISIWNTRKKPLQEAKNFVAQMEAASANPTPPEEDHDAAVPDPMRELKQRILDKLPKGPLIIDYLGTVGGDQTPEQKVAFKAAADKLVADLKNLPGGSWFGAGWDHTFEMMTASPACGDKPVVYPLPTGVGKTVAGLRSAVESLFPKSSAVVRPSDPSSVSLVDRARTIASAALFMPTGVAEAILKDMKTDNPALFEAIKMELEALRIRQSQAAKQMRGKDQAANFEATYGGQRAAYVLTERDANTLNTVMMGMQPKAWTEGDKIGAVLKAKGKLGGLVQCCIRLNVQAEGFTAFDVLADHDTSGKPGTFTFLGGDSAQHEDPLHPNHPENFKVKPVVAGEDVRAGDLLAVEEESSTPPGPPASEEKQRVRQPVEGELVALKNARGQYEAALVTAVHPEYHPEVSARIDVQLLKTGQYVTKVAYTDDAPGGYRFPRTSLGHVGQPVAVGDQVSLRLSADHTLAMRIDTVDDAGNITLCQDKRPGSLVVKNAKQGPYVGTFAYPPVSVAPDRAEDVAEAPGNPPMDTEEWAYADRPPVVGEKVIFHHRAGDLVTTLDSVDSRGWAGMRVFGHPYSGVRFGNEIGKFSYPPKPVPYPSAGQGSAPFLDPLGRSLPPLGKSSRAERLVREALEESPTPLLDAFERGELGTPLPPPIDPSVLTEMEFKDGRAIYRSINGSDHWCVVTSFDETTGLATIVVRSEIPEGAMVRPPDATFHNVPKGVGKGMYRYVAPDPQPADTDQGPEPEIGRVVDFVHYHLHGPAKRYRGVLVEWDPAKGLGEITVPGENWTVGNVPLSPTYPNTQPNTFTMLAEPHGHTMLGLQSS